jgi:4-amino-4-deoxy-L-arabinose transferase-like glycosyltransferase
VVATTSRPRLCAVHETPFAARLPFALLGLLTIALVYGIVFRVARQRWAAASAALLLTLSVQFLLYSRQSRYYTLAAALSCLLVWQFLRLSSWKRTALFATTAVLLFHSHPITIAPVAAMGALTLLSKSFRDERRWFWRAVPFVAACTVPWLALASGAYAENSGHYGGPVPGPVRQMSSGSVTALGVLAALVVIAARRGRSNRSPRTNAAW